MQQAEALLDRLVNEQTSGVVYHIGDWENPMSAQGELAPQPHELPELTGWVRETLDVSSELSSNYPVVILGAGGPVTAVLWRTQGFAALLFCEGDAAVARVLGQTRCRV